MPRVRRRRAKPHDPSTNVSTASDDPTLPLSPPCNVTLPAPAIAFMDPSTPTLTSGTLAQYTTGGNAGPVPLATQAVHSLPHSPVPVTAPISPSVPRTFISDPSAARKVTVLSVHPISSAPISESSRVEATRPGPFQKANYHGCVYASMAPNWLRVVGSLLRWRRMVGVLRRGDWSDDWHGQFGKFQGARLLWFNIALCSLQFRTLLAFRVAYQ
jgi:hypothetical protein